MRRYAGQNEVRFKVTDKQAEIYRETACYFYENSLMEKSNIQSLEDGAWIMYARTIDLQSYTQI
jgi:hypothetical protein